ncbi:Na+/H+ antiporter NhaC family protein [Haloarchaeobius sp. TZWWS8]|uniref:Na+/H+ antiporter NhaC family protein n=1 Tax=Haloarchaeobius sp. TZWWS8 TaxID=3446121 RepID=UPI003EB6C3A2
MAETFGLISLVPALLAILLTLLTRQALLSLFAGVWMGATILVGWNPLAGAARSLQFVVENVTATFNATMLLFTFLIGAMLGMIFLSGGMRALADRIVSAIKTRRQAQIGTAGLGLVIFFDSYASTMITGSVMRPVTDRYNISREKLAYILDSTTAPMASISVISTWLGFELGLIRDQFQKLGVEQSPFVVFLESIPYRFYSIFALILVFAVVLGDWNIGPMKRAEERARNEGKLVRDDANPMMETQAGDIETPDHVDAKWWYFVAPILAVVATTVFSLFYTGGIMNGTSIPAALWSAVTGLTLAPIIDPLLTGTGPTEALSNAGTAKSLLWSSMAGCATILYILVVHARIALEDVSDSIFEGFKMVMFPIAILSLAWSMGAVSSALGVGPYVVSVAEGVITPGILPAVVFFSAALISFSIGTSWGTMSILFPVAVPLAFNLGTPLAPAIGAILTGSLFGDHCSPISDTTVMSSMFAASDHVDHVNTQVPYAFLAAGVAIVSFLLAGMTGLGGVATVVLGALVVVSVAYVLSEQLDRNVGIDVARVFGD